MKQTDLRIISELRKNGRAPLTELSRKLQLPVSTIHDRLKQYLRKEWLRFSVLPAYDKIGYSARAYILLSVEPTEKDKLFKYLTNNPNVNSIYRINNCWNAMLDCIFKDMTSLEDFMDNIESNFHIKQKQVHYILGELKSEGFLTEPVLFEGKNGA
ncbi:MAG: Lrp/AsnC family transcriptional regulator [Candidatus Woesearchaeota archaeon]